MRNTFSLFQSHLDLAHHYWERGLKSGDIAVDATCGNGHDTCFLASKGLGHLHAIDIQEEALSATKKRLSEELSEDQLKRVSFHLRCHSTFPEKIEEGSVALIVYNLGYLPAGDKEKTTLSETTLLSLKAAMPLVKEGGLISVTCYPGHPQGAVEEQEVVRFCAELNPSEWSCCYHTWLNRKKSPSLLLLQKAV